MSQYQENYGQYSTNSQQGLYPGLNVEDQPNEAAQQQASWGGYDPSGAQQSASWEAGDTNARARGTSGYSAPPVQPMYSNDPQYQQGTTPLLWPNVPC